jgi:hypothetical protein
MSMLGDEVEAASLLEDESSDGSGITGFSTV